MLNHLTVVVPYFNPGNFNSHISRYQGFAEHMADSGVKLITVECAFPGQRFVVTNAGLSEHVQVRSETPLWLKENLLNLGFARATTPYVMWCDGDFRFEDSNWPTETVALLRRYPVCQPWSHLILRGPENEPLDQLLSFTARYPKSRFGPLPNIPNRNSASSGGCWAFRQDAMKSIGGLFDLGILGDADDIMAYSFLNRVSEQFGRWPRTVIPYALKWQERAHKFPITGLEATVNHQWHGSLASRQYQERWKILVEEGYNPAKDLRRNSYGVWDCIKPRLACRIADYFHSRLEDAC